MLNGLAGVPDFYQGCELWDLRFVDPDNQGPIDFKHRGPQLSEIEIRIKKPNVTQETMYCVERSER
jgi:(1->4)-alpha-D-glucan 1-alpha-D-glucosylmutase